MSHFANVDEKNLVAEIIVVDAEYIADKPGLWIQVSYNTRGGVNSAGGTPLRKNYPGIGWIYDPVNDGFHAPEPAPIQGYGRWTLDPQTFLWSPPAGWTPKGL